MMMMKKPTKEKMMKPPTHNKVRSQVSLSRADIKGISDNGEIRIAVSSDKTLLRQMGWGGAYNETLSHDDGAINNMEYIRANGIPILLEHNNYEYNAVVGRATDPEIITDSDGTKKLMLTMNMGGTAKSDEVRSLVERGYLKDVSVSYTDDMISVKERELSPPRNDGMIVPEPEFDVRFESWRMTEVSFVAMGADVSVGTGARADGLPQERVEK